MHFRFDDDQLAMRDAVRALCADHVSLESVAEREGEAASSTAWSALAELGVLGMLADERSGFGLIEAAIVVEELGAHLVSGPVLWTILAAPFVPGAGDGTTRVTGVDLDHHHGGPLVVDHGEESQVLVVVRSDRVERHATSELPRALPGAAMDPLTPVAVLAEVPGGGEHIARADAGRLRRDGAVLAAAALVGGAQGALEVARRYALEREQFGVPIGSFQAIKHLLADMYVRVEMARAATYAAAALAAGRGDGDAHRAASAAKHLAGDAAVANGRTAVQVLGGMGFTWEMLPHRFLKRAFVLDRAFGTSSWHAARLGAAVGAEVAA